MSRESFLLSMLYSLILLSFSLRLSVEGAEEVLPTSSCYGFWASCTDASSLCFPSSKPGFAVRSSEKHETGTINPQQSVSFGLGNGGTVMCSSVESVFADGGVRGRGFSAYETNPCQAPLIPDDWMKASNGVTNDLEDVDVKDAELGRGNGSPSPYVEVTPSMLDWGISSLYVASVSTLTLINSHQDSVLDVYEPYCTDPQFYPYNFEELSIEPGENASISFVFLPRNLGLNSAQVVLQTSFGGFVLQAVGVANESAYNIEPLVGIDLRVGGVLSKTLSIHNPFEESIYVEEVAVWMSAPESVSQLNHAVCQLGTSSISSSEAEWFNMGNEWYGLPRVDIRPVSNWVVSPMNDGTIVELRLQADSQGEVFGAICMRLRNIITQRVITVVVPIEVQVHEHDYPNHGALAGLGSVSASFNSHVACDEGGSIFTLYLKNDGLDSLRIVDIFEEGEGEKMYEIRYLKHLVLIPASTTAVALISRKPSNAMSEISEAEGQCNLVVETNHSSDAFLRIPCQDFARASIANGGVPDLGSEPEMQQKEAMSADTRLLGGMSEDSTEKLGPFKEVEASNLILANWLSHGKAAASSVSVNQLVLFPPVQIGSYSARPITVKNPGPVPALVQLVLNSEELVTDCKTSDDDSSEHTIPNRSPEIGTTEMRFGFSVADSGLTEVVLHPFESALLGPVIFHPSSRCTWLSSALIRSNISGIEWISLHASGGSHSISLLDGSEPVQKLQLEFDMDPLKNISSSLQSEVTCPSCDHRLSKEIYAKNTGELPLEIKKIRVSGIDCRSEGFTISSNCLGFNLLPGESELIGVSYRPDFTSGMVHRDLELVMAGGIFVIPMKVQVPLCMVGQCRKASVFWRASILLLFAAMFFAVVLVFVRVMPLSLTSGSSEYYYRLDNTACCASQDDKRLFFHHSTKSSRSIGREQKKQERPPFMSNYAIPQSPPKRLETDLISSDQLKKPASPSSYSSLKPTKDHPVPAPPVVTSQTDNTNNLTIRVVREKGKRRKKRTPSNNSNLAAKLEVSSSHSSNSTPSSPLSPSGSTPKQVWPLSPNSDPTTNAFRPVATSEEVNVTRKIENEPSYYPSLVFSGPHASNSIFVSKTSPIAPPARAPGPKVAKQTSAKREENDGVSARQFTYDMWADHFSGRVMYAAAEGRDADYSKSFFAIQPQASPSYGANLNKTGYNGNVTGVSGIN